jgi:hypothetical protein
MVLSSFEEVFMTRVEMVPGWQAKLDGAINKFMEQLADDVLSDMREHCPVDSGALLADLDSEVHGKAARIGARSVPYAIYVEEGVGPHVITPNSAGALFWEGAPHPVDVVHHPGQDAQHFMKKALYKARG